MHRGVAEFEKNFKSQREFLGIVNEKIFEKNDLKGKDLEGYNLIRSWVKQK